jgi:hypothetical protein
MRLLHNQDYPRLQGAFLPLRAYCCAHCKPLFCNAFLIKPYWLALQAIGIFL